MVGDLGFGAAGVSFAKVKGHATNSDVRRGIALAIDKHGNDQADELACAGGDLHAAPPGLVSMATQRRLDAMQVHRMMLDILSARRRMVHTMSTGELVDDCEAAELAEGDLHTEEESG